MAAALRARQIAMVVALAWPSLSAACSSSESERHPKRDPVERPKSADGADATTPTTKRPDKLVAPPSNAPAKDALVYLVTIDQKLYSFDPRISGTSAYRLVGPLDCHDYGTPQSMGVDRRGTAWVFYDSGHLFRVSVADASCLPTPYVHPPGTRQLGMGFTSVAPGSADDLLFVASPAWGLATIRFPSLSLDRKDTPGLFGELTGGGDGRLFTFEAEVGRIGEIDRSSKAIKPMYQLKNHRNTIAWAFSRYAGRFYLFTAGYGEPSRCLEVDVEKDRETVRDADIGFTVVGAGQSTLVPIRDGGSGPSDKVQDDFKP